MDWMEFSENKVEQSWKTRQSLDERGLSWAPGGPPWASAHSGILTEFTLKPNDPRLWTSSSTSSTGRKDPAERIWWQIWNVSLPPLHFFYFFNKLVKRKLKSLNKNRRERERGKRTVCKFKKVLLQIIFTWGYVHSKSSPEKCKF